MASIFATIWNGSAKPWWLHARRRSRLYDPDKTIFTIWGTVRKALPRKYRGAFFKDHLDPIHTLWGTLGACREASGSAGGKRRSFCYADTIWGLLPLWMGHLWNWPILLGGDKVMVKRMFPSDELQGWNDNIAKAYEEDR